MSVGRGEEGLQLAVSALLVHLHTTQATQNWPSAFPPSPGQGTVCLSVPLHSLSLYPVCLPLSTAPHCALSVCPSPQPLTVPCLSVPLHSLSLCPVCLSLSTASHCTSPYAPTSLLFWPNLTRSIGAMWCVHLHHTLPACPTLPHPHTYILCGLNGVSVCVSV